MTPDRPDIAALHERRFFECRREVVAIIFRAAVRVLEEARELFFVKAHEPEVEVLALEMGQLNAQHFVIPSRIERETVVGEDERPLLGIRQALGVDTRHARHALGLRRFHAPVAAEDRVLLVNHDRRDETKLPERRAQLLDLLLAVRPRIPRIRHELVNRDLLEFLCICQGSKPPRISNPKTKRPREMLSRSR